MEFAENEVNYRLIDKGCQTGRYSARLAFSMIFVISGLLRFAKGELRNYNCQILETGDDGETRKALWPFFSSKEIRLTRFAIFFSRSLLLPIALSRVIIVDLLKSFRMCVQVRELLTCEYEEDLIPSHT